eukprot:GHVU01119605.1.p1 GENE.GHVU01119605.1~~GHVU01119605.1.p1  ORF type:complete len:205 (+),score=25.89 GHVU01119605.1:1697-2311(+)
MLLAAGIPLDKKTNDAMSIVIGEYMQSLETYVGGLYTQGSDIEDRLSKAIIMQEMLEATRDLINQRNCSEKPGDQEPGYQERLPYATDTPAADFDSTQSGSSNKPLRKAFGGTYTHKDGAAGEENFWNFRSPFVPIESNPKVEEARRMVKAMKSKTDAIADTPPESPIVVAHTRQRAGSDADATGSDVEDEGEDQWKFRNVADV